jgi:ESCRT-I complex subunit TSG101
MSEAFSQSPPVYSNAGASVHSTSYKANPSMAMQSTTGNASSSYPQGYPQTTISQDIIRDSIQSAVLDKIRNRFDETIQIGNAQIDSLRKTEQDLLNGEKKIQSLIHEIKQQQNQAEVYIFFFFYSLI